MTTPVGRPTSISCPVSTATGYFPDAGASCDPDAGAACSPGLKCLHGACGLDACRTDSDCQTGFACICAGDFYGGNGIHGNVCVTSQCRVDADCGPAEVCSPSFGEGCGGPSGVFCHSSADTCGTDADCCGSTPGCRYQSTLGHWACQSVALCNG
jgi:hypothetical protein